MKTTRTILASIIAVIASYLIARGLSHLALPIAEVFEYGVGSMVALGLIAMSVAQPYRPLPSGKTEKPAATGIHPMRRNRVPYRPRLSHAA